MTRGKKLSVVFAVVMLVLASGTALAMAASSNQASATNSEGVQQETTAAATETEQTEETASVSLSDQESDGNVITVDSVTVPEGGFVAVHDETLLDGDAVGSVVGVSRYLEPGTYEDLQIVLDRPISETQTLIAMPHLDTNENQAYGFTISDGNVDGAYTSGGAAVVSDAEITVSGAATEATTDAADGEVTEEPATEEPATEEPVTEEPATEEPATEIEETTEAPATEAPETEVPETEVPATEVPTETDGAEVPEQLVFQIENVEIDEWSFVVGDSTEPDRTEVIEGGTLTDRTVEVNLTELATGESTMSEAMGQSVAQQTTPETPEASDLNASDVETVRYVIRDVDIENVTFVVTGLEQLQEMEELPTDVPTEVPATTEVEDDDEFETTEAVETEEVTEVEETTEEVETTEQVTEIEETTEAVEETEQVTEVEETTEAEEPTEVEETTQAGGAQAFEVENLQAPQTASAGDVITVSATVTNPGDVENTEEVDFRIQGDVIDSQTVTLDAGESREITFQIDTSQLQSGDYVQGVYGDQRGQVALITIDEGDAATETGDAATETGEETTEAPATTEGAAQQIAVQITA